ncbi:MAG: hypothetical protein PCFJNLEI_01919 [Verrucomicrobiae bacterium]|nr:hypothetical protein [Verrucomicrobiae bacterium]
MLTILLFFLLTLPAAWAQRETADAALTNKPTDFSTTILDPGTAIHDVTIPEFKPTDIPLGLVPAAVPEIPSATNIATPRPRPRPYQTNSPFGSNFITIPTAKDLATRTVEIVAPPLPPINAPPQGSPEPPPVEAVATNSAKSYFVATAGNDAADGSEDTPWRTIQKAAASAQPGDVVTVLPGTYEAFHTVNAGETNRPITFRADGQVIIVPLGGEAPTGLQPKTMAEIYRVDNIHVRDTDNIIIDGFHVQRAGRTGISVIESRNVIVRNNVVGPSGRFGIFTGFAPGVQIISNKTFGAAIEHGIYVSNSRVTNDNPVIRYNETFGNARNGIQLNGDCAAGGDGSLTGALLEGNIVRDNGMKGLSLISMSDSVVQNNLIYNNGKFAGAGGIHLTDEIGCGKASSGNVIVNNTVVEPRIACIRITDGATNNIIFNNLLVGSRPVVDEVGGNQIDTDSNIRLDSAIGIFNNSEASDYRPLLTSPAKNAGVGVYREKRAPLLDREGQRRRTALGFDAGAY